MTEFSGRSDPARILPLLWRHGKGGRRAATGRPARLSVDAVVSAAIRLADAEGLAAASMGRLATTLDVGTMTLYTYVKSRSDLLDLMVDQALLDRALPGPGEARPRGWRAQVELFGERTRAVYRSHPWLAQVSRMRPPIGPGTIAESEYVLSVVTQTGLPLERLSTAATVIAGFVTAAAHRDAEAELLRRATGESNDTWWLSRAELWEWFDGTRFPTMTRIWKAGGYRRSPDQEAEESYHYGLSLLLDGIEHARPGPATEPDAGAG
ncbi:TetR/AcrR family transcriptional regulator [Actinoplanes subtropicus]|uniref:TetR/AcrR family transcriptional regulator n=1 Tax=Actinoplanes subtropicus TaxID=543632 RepID=UPI0004C3ABCE|nr:TetR/AcrR family transcriptional regulator C-terminal domain-containing protein [Actinoplanes subtropicus]